MYTYTQTQMNNELINLHLTAKLQTNINWVLLVGYLYRNVNLKNQTRLDILSAFVHLLQTLNYKKKYAPAYN